MASQLIFLRYGNYSHALAEASVSIDRQPTFGENNIQTGFKETWQITGLLQAATQAELHAAILALQSAYSVQGQAIGLFFADGTPTAHVINVAETQGGCRVTGAPSYPEGEGAEAGLFRTYRITVEATISDPTATISSFNESLSFSGGGPRKAWQEYIADTPELHTLALATTYKATQSGSAVGRFGYPTVPGPHWPAALMKPPNIQIKNPKRMGPIGAPYYTDYEVTWSYEFESASPLFGFPNYQL